MKIQKEKVTVNGVNSNILRLLLWKEQGNFLEI